jgi:flavorubredoxin
MKPIQIAKDIYWVGAVDWNLRDFHGYLTEAGTTYNAYLIMDEKVTLIDTVKKEFADQLLTNIAEIVDPKKVDYVVSNHTEPDHSGGLPRIMHKIGEEKPLFCSKVGHKNLSLHYREKLNFRPVENGGSLNIGRRNLTFLETRMVHWPDSMFTYCPEDKILFSSDGFGQHYAGPEHFDDEVGEAIMPHARKYFANILLLYAPLILQLVEKVTQMNLDIHTICPDHGIIWRKDPGKIIQAYVDWSRQEPKQKAIVVYDSMWHSTQTMAETIVSGLVAEGIEARPMHLR